jgi:CubicO group peptidase (beta-lactamase class C family)
MNRYQFTTLLMLSLFSLYCYAENQNSKKSPTQELDISAKEIVSALSFFPDKESGGTFLITQNGNHIASAALGKSNLELDVDIKLDNVFNIASVTKPFTAVAIFTLIETGKISLADKVLKFVPNFPKEGQDITIGHLLSHTSGMAFKNDQMQRDKFKKSIRTKNNDRFIVEYFTKDKFDTKPGEKYDYNNAAYQLLGHIIEQVSGKTYEEYLQETFFTPLNMRNTLLESDIKVIKGRATGYDFFNRKDYQIKATNSDDSYYYSAGGIMSTVEDLSIWYEALMNYKIITKRNVEKLTTPAIYNDGSFANNGYGVFTGNLNGHNFILHI